MRFGCARQARIYEPLPLTLGAGVGAVVWDDGVLGVRHDRALQLTQPGRDSDVYAPAKIPLVIVGFSRSASGAPRCFCRLMCTKTASRSGLGYPHEPNS